MGKGFDYVLMPLLLPFLAAWYLLAYLCAILGTLLIVPSVLLANRLYWCCPFIPHIWKSYGLLGAFLKISFEASYCINVLKRMFTLPLRRKLPDFYIVGFPVTSLTLYLTGFSFLHLLVWYGRRLERRVWRHI